MPEIKSTTTATTITYLHAKILELYKTNPNIHLSIVVSRPKKVYEDVPAKILDVYANFFRVEIMVENKKQVKTIPYTDVLIKDISVKEIEIS